MPLATRTIQSPGFEINEIDRSSYDNVNRALVGTTSLVIGFADKGTDYSVTWVNSKATLNGVYGFPKTEAERYFYNAGVEILNRGGVLLMAKLPYKNDSKDHYTYVDYKLDVDTLITSDNGKNCFNIIKEDLDNSLTSCIKITQDDGNSGLMNNDEFDDIITTRKFKGVKSNVIRIVDITRSKYGKIQIPTIDNDSKIISDMECLGIMPVITTAKNAFVYQNLLVLDNNITNEREVTPNLTCFNPVSKFNQVGTIDNLNPYANILQENFTIKLSSDYIYDETVSRIASEQFPNINFLSEKFLDRKYLKQIGVVVFIVSRDVNNPENITFLPVESFVGSLDKNARDDETNASIYIDNIVNNNSQYVNLFSKIDDTNENYIKASYLDTTNLQSTVLGFTEQQCEKNIDYNESIITSLNYILENASDPNIVPLDIVIDAGLTNIASLLNNQRYDPSTNQSSIVSQKTKWKAIAQKFDDFCRKRADCIFILDGMRQFCLDGNSKIIRKTTPEHTVEKRILPNLKHMTGINSSYVAGYCNWFMVEDDYTKDYFWLPPSIKVASAMVYTDTYSKPWFAPAGFNRGAVNGAIDVAFNTSKESETGKIYSQGWNYAVTYPLQGTIIEGQKTMTLKKSAFDRINVRRMFLYLRKAVLRASRSFNYMQNNEYNRQRFVDALVPIFRRVVEGGGISEFVIKCDEENNPPNVIDNNELRLAIAIKPVKCLEFVVLNFICTNQSANVQEEIISNY